MQPVVAGIFVTALLSFCVSLIAQGGRVKALDTAHPIFAAAHSRDAHSGPEPGSAVRRRDVTSCQILDRAGTEYVLKSDVRSAGTCFSIQADDITLDLNQHSITYGIASPTYAAFGILGIACWDYQLTHGVAKRNPCGGQFDDLTVSNGSIIQAPGVAAFSDAIHLGQGGGDGLRVHDVEFSLQANSSIAVYTNSSGAGAVVSNNIIRNNVTAIRNRHQLEGMSIKFDDSGALRKGQIVNQNKIFGGAQGGILLLTPGAKAYGNEIRQDSHYSNDFALYMWGNKQEVFDNLIDTISGRGIQIGGGAVSINGHEKGGRDSAAHDNRIQVVELKQNCEYGAEASTCHGCQEGGAYGIQFDDNPQGDSSFKNAVLARAGDCDASALRITDSRTEKNESHDDEFVAVRLRADSTGKAYGWDNDGPVGFTAARDVFSGDTASYHVGWDGAQHETCLSCTLRKGNSNLDPHYVTFSFENGGNNPVRDIHFRDTKFENGAAKDSVSMRPMDALNWPGYSEYYLDWTLKLDFENESAPLGDADVVIRDSSDHVVYQGKTDRQGEVTLVITEFKMFNTPTSVVTDRYNPFHVAVTRKNCQPSDTVISVDHTTTRAIQLTCNSN